MCDVVARAASFIYAILHVTRTSRRPPLTSSSTVPIFPHIQLYQFHHYMHTSHPHKSFAKKKNSLPHDSFYVAHPHFPSDIRPTNARRLIRHAAVTETQIHTNKRSRFRDTQSSNLDAQMPCLQGSPCVSRGLSGFDSSVDLCLRHSTVAGGFTQRADRDGGVCTYAGKSQEV
jgi:hypothetical protein